MSILVHLSAAKAILEADEIVAVPAETVYGLAGNAYRNKAVQEIFRLKGRPAFNPLIVHEVSMKRLAEYAHITPLAQVLAQKFWPGPLTMVLKKRAGDLLSPLTSSGLETVAVRFPAHPVFQNLLNHLSFPLAAPSANPSGLLSPTRIEHVAEAFPALPILSGLPSKIGLESTVIDVQGKRPILLRWGAIVPEDIKIACGLGVEMLGNACQHVPLKIHAPGQLLTHYSPFKPVRMNASDVQPSEGLLAFGKPVFPGAFCTEHLSRSGCLQEAAANFFQSLHKLDKQPITRIAVMPLPEKGLGCALNDRLRRMKK